MGRRVGILLLSIMALICGIGSAQDLPKLPPNNFWNKTNKALFASHAVLEALDFGITHHNLSNGGKELDSSAKALCESGTPGQLVFFGGRMAGVIAVSLSAAQNRPSQAGACLSVYADGDSAYGVAYSFAHRYEGSRGDELPAPTKDLCRREHHRSCCASIHLARARTRVTSSGCSSAPIQSSTAAVTISVIRGQRQVTIFPHQVDQPLLAKFAEFIFRFGHAVGVGKKYFAGP